MFIRIVKRHFLWIVTNTIRRNIFNARYGKHALISYSVFPFITGSSSHSNHQESIAIARVFHEMGYCVDVVHYNNPYFSEFSKYDVVFGFGLPFESSFRGGRTLKRVYYATGAHACFQNHAEINRVKAVNEKYNSAITPKRIVDWMWSQSTTMSDAIVVVGNEWTKSTYSVYTDTVLHTINVTALVNREAVNISRDINISKGSYLWFGSTGLIHKGLDLCLEYFSCDPSMQLHICGVKEQDFFEIFGEMLSLPNIHYHGFVDVQGNDFLEIIKKCAFAILPTCSEGQATALLTAMGAGLVPISTMHCGIDIKSCGYIIPSLDENGLDTAISMARNASDQEIQARSKAAQNLVLTEHNIDAFFDNLRNIMRILA